MPEKFLTFVHLPFGKKRSSSRRAEELTSLRMTPFFVGLTGGSASGKTLFLRRLLDAFAPGEVCLVSQDHYYRPREEQPRDANGIANFDTPASINAALYVRDLRALRAGQSVLKTEYTFNNPQVVPQTLRFDPTPVVLVEGLFVLYYPEIAQLLDLRLFIDAGEHIKLSRRIVRDREERGYDLSDVLYRYEHHVAPTYEQYIKPFKSQADLVITNDHGFDKALAVIVAFLRGEVAARRTPPNLVAPSE